MAKRRGFHNNGLMVRWLPLLILATGCVTVRPQDEIGSSKSLGGIVATGTHHETATGNNAQLGAYVQVRGTVMCGTGSPRPAGEYRAEVYRQGTPIGAIALDQRKTFDFLKASPYGTHEARLVEKRSGRVLDKYSFNTSVGENRFDIVFADCQPATVKK